MKAKQYIKTLNALVDKYGDLDLCYAIDDEGNGFQLVIFEPATGTLKDYDEFDITEDKDKVTHICLN